MLSFLTFILGSWNETYPGSDIPPNIRNFIQVDQYRTTTAGNLYIFQVTFMTLNEPEDSGGAISTNTTTKLLIESSHFIQCHSKGKGGAIYFVNNADGVSFIKKVCMSNSYSSASNCHFCLISTKSASGCTNCLEDSTVGNLRSASGVYYGFQLANSENIVMKYDNITNNESYNFCGYSFDTCVSGSVVYTSLENNTSTVNSGDVLSLGGQQHVIDMCNFIGNYANRAIMYVGCTLNVTNSCMLENKHGMFNIGYNNIVYIINCTMDNMDSHGGRFEVDNSSIPEKSFMIDLDIYHCFEKDMSITEKLCPTYDMKKNKCRIDKYRGILILARY